MLILLINILIIIVVGAIAFYLIDRFVRDGRLGNLLKILVIAGKRRKIRRLQIWKRAGNIAIVSDPAHMFVYRSISEQHPPPSIRTDQISIVARLIFVRNE